MATCMKSEKFLFGGKARVPVDTVPVSHYFNQAEGLTIVAHALVGVELYKTMKLSPRCY